MKAVIAKLRHLLQNLWIILTSPTCKGNGTACTVCHFPCRFHIVNNKKNVPCDTVIMSLGVRPTGLDPAITKLTYKCINVGDAMHAGRIADATHTAYKAAMALK